MHGKGTAVRAGTNAAYGIQVHRSAADIAVKVIRVSDGKVLAVEDVMETAGGEAQPTSARKALRGGGKKIAAQVVRALKRIQDD